MCACVSVNDCLVVALHFIWLPIPIRCCQDKLEGRFSENPIVKLRPIFPTDFGDIKTVNGHDSDPQVVLIWSKSVRKICEKNVV